MKKIAFCGDSFFSVDPMRPNTHFSELICKNNNLELVNNSIPGCSNTYIGFQILDIVINHEDVDLVVIGFTSSDRFDSVIKSFNKKIKFESIIDLYKNKKIFSNVIHYILSEKFKRNDLFEDVDHQHRYQEATEKYFREIYNEEISFYQDLMILISMLNILKNKNINFICVNHFNPNRKNVKFFSSIAKVDIIDFDLLSCLRNYKDDVSFNHINDEGQVEIANRIVNLINATFNKNLKNIT